MTVPDAKSNDRNMSVQFACNPYGSLQFYSLYNRSSVSGTLDQCPTGGARLSGLAQLRKCVTFNQNYGPSVNSFRLLSCSKTATAQFYSNLDCFDDESAFPLNNSECTQIALGISGKITCQSSNQFVSYLYDHRGCQRAPIAVLAGSTNTCVPLGGSVSFQVDCSKFLPYCHCFSATKDFDEEKIDCGGKGCPVCAGCVDGLQNGKETGIDCGGPDCIACPPSCTDGVKNGLEQGVDCGGPVCFACPGTDPSFCFDGKLSKGETDIDCGDKYCTKRCSEGQRCLGDSDCRGSLSGCVKGKCFDTTEALVFNVIFTILFGLAGIWGVSQFRASFKAARVQADKTRARESTKMEKARKARQVAVDRLQKSEQEHSQRRCEALGRRLWQQQQQQQNHTEQQHQAGEASRTGSGAGISAEIGSSSAMASAPSFNAHPAKGSSEAAMATSAVLLNIHLDTGAFLDTPTSPQVCADNELSVGASASQPTPEVVSHETASTGNPMMGIGTPTATVTEKPLSIPGQATVSDVVIPGEHAQVDTNPLNGDSQSVPAGGAAASLSELVLTDLIDPSASKSQDAELKSTDLELNDVIMVTEETVADSNMALNKSVRRGASGKLELSSTEFLKPTDMQSESDARSSASASSFLMHQPLDKVITTTPARLYVAATSGSVSSVRLLPSAPAGASRAVLPARSEPSTASISSQRARVPGPALPPRTKNNLLSPSPSQTDSRRYFLHSGLRSHVTFPLNSKLLRFQQRHRFAVCVHQAAEQLSVRRVYSACRDVSNVKCWAARA